MLNRRRLGAGEGLVSSLREVYIGVQCALPTVSWVVPKDQGLELRDSGWFIEKREWEKERQRQKLSIEFCFSKQLDYMLILSEKVTVRK